MLNSSVCYRFISIPARVMLTESDLCQQQRYAMIVLSERSIGDEEMMNRISSGLQGFCSRVGFRV